VEVAQFSAVAELKAHLARAYAEISILRRGSPADVTMLGAVAKAMRAPCSLTTHQVEDLGRADPWLDAALTVALGDDWNAQKIGWRLRKLAGPYVVRESVREREGRTWWLHPILVTFAPLIVTSVVAEDRPA